MAHRFLAINVLAGAVGVHGLRDMEPVGRGDADDIHGRVGQQFVVFGVGLGAVGLGGLLQPIAVGVAYRDDLDACAVDQPLDGGQMARAAPAHPDEPDADAVVGAHDASGRDERGVNSPPAVAAAACEDLR